MGRKDILRKKRHRVDGKEIEAHQRRHRRKDDFARVEPVHALSPVEHELERAQAGGEHEETEPIEGIVPPPRRFGNERGNHDEGGHGDGYVDVEPPAPVLELDDVASDDRPQRHPKHGAQGPPSHGQGQLLLGKGGEKGGLADWHESRRESPLDEAQNDDFDQRVGLGHENGSHGESDDRDQQQPLASDAARYGAGKRRHYDCGHHVGRHDPRYLVLGCRKRALHVG